MGIFGPFTCAYCGNIFRGLKWSVKGGKCVCGQCYDKFSKDRPYEEWKKSTIAQIKAYYEDKQQVAAQGECAFCGHVFDASDIYTYVLKDRKKICYGCAEKVRIVCPVYCTEDYDTAKYEYVPAVEDPLEKLELKELFGVLQNADAERKKRAEQYGSHKAVFIVDDVMRYNKAPDKAEAHRIFGRAVLGRIDPGDRVCVQRREGPRFIDVTSVDCQEYNKKAKSLSEGHDGALAVSGDVSFIYPGDVLTVN